MTSLFILIPILGNYLFSLINYTNYKLMISFTIGIYGLFQFFFQIPFGIISDYFGRKLVILIGLLLTAIGSIIMIYSQSIFCLMIGRAIQGSGAIGSTLIACLHDLIKKNNRFFAMFIIGIIFGISFAISFIIGPIIYYNLGLKLIFIIMLLFSIISIIITLIFLPNKINKKINDINFSIFIKNVFFTLFYKKYFLILIFSIMILHFILVSNFILLPNLLNVYTNNHWKIYFYTILISFIFNIFYFKNYNNSLYIKKNKIIKLSILFIILSETIFFILHANLLKNVFWLLLLGIQIFFLGFNTLESLLPSIISNEFKKQKASAIAVYSSIQFLGTALGGIIGGFLNYNNSIFLFNFLLSLLWFLLTVFFNKNKNNI